ncbi:MAG: sigma-54-dependent Fis family transcriptional regulator [Phycisphaeraceae bacterium]|nr:sigma-54-dependent Fis family transcriptional regulator [Phycisphaeraceae bacterium]
MTRSDSWHARVWRQASRPVDVVLAVPMLAELIREQLPMDRLMIVAWDDEGAALTCLAAFDAQRGDGEPLPATRNLSASDRRVLRSWHAQHKVTLLPSADSPSTSHPTRILLGDLETASSRHWLALPLVLAQGGGGAAMMSAEQGRSFEPRDVELASQLADPLAAMLDNHHRLHELRALREAAEADKRSALTRLGREGLVDAIVGAEAGLKPVLERVTLVARSDVPILILGETGSGKEVIARAVHDQSPRAKGPFIRVNCGAIAPELIDSELFGHEKGSFTGATAQRHGWFERADEGTLLLDEIGELPLPAQVRLLRVLQEGTFDRVGGHEPVHVNVRIVAATHRDLPSMVQNGRFREDLWYRISSFPILLPPLRERTGDIPALARHFASRAARRFGLRSQEPTPDDLAALLAYDWPGNVRELQSVIDRAAILGDGQRLDVIKALGGSPRPASPLRTAAMEQPQQAGPMLSLDEAMRHHIAAALTATRGRIEGPYGAAKLLRINPHTLRAKMRRLRLDWSRFREPVS